MTAGRDTHAWYDAELAALHELGAGFAAAHPDAAHLLSGSGADPSVERLLQGVAFLNARVRERIDDELPEVAYPLLRTLFPGWLRPLPPVVIQAFEAADLGASALVPAGTRVRSLPVRLDDRTPAIACTFDTAWDVTVPPFTLREVTVSPAGPHETLELTFAMPAGRVLSDLARSPLDRLRIHVHDVDAAFAAAIVAHLTHGGTGPAPRPILTVGGVRRHLPPARPVGFEPGEGVLEATGEPGLRLLTEYLAFPRKLLFFEIAGLEVLATLGDHDRFTVAFPLTRPFRDAHRVRATHLVLGATPAVNRFERAAHPIRRLPLRPEHRILPSGRDHDAYEVLDVREVTGLRQGARAAVAYRPLHEAMATHGVGDQPWFDLRLRRDPARRATTTWLVLSPADRPDQDERISLTLSCSHGALPAALRPGDVHEVTGSSARVRTRNLDTPTPSLAPPVGTALPWRLVGLLAAAGALSDVGALRQLVSLHNHRLASGDARDVEVHRRRLSALRALDPVPADRLVPVRQLPGADRRAPPAAMAMCRGTRVALSVGSTALEGEGGSWMLGAVLDRVFAGRAAINAFSQLVVHDVDGAHGDLRWPARIGQHLLA
ncbi:MAG: type VI secretion system baseplate subunit TssF [Alphaproteobacteria bacterium]|nr:type VI secretion system baseplate subunit TssF [Alphaproteobacteria bacterium]